MDPIKKFNIKISGSGRQPILFAHGFGCDQNMWRLVAPAFEQEYKTVLFDYQGHGQSDASSYSSAQYNSLAGYAKDVLDICEYLQLDNVIFVGHSVSAMIGILAANKKPELFDKLVLIGPSPCYINDKNYHGGFTREDIASLLESLESNYMGWSSVMAPVIMGNADKPELGKELTTSFCSTDPDIARQFAEVTFMSDNRKDLRELQVPSLVIQCEEDVIAPEVVGRYVATQVKDADFVMLQATGHCPHLSAPEETIKAIQHFLNSRKA